MRDDFDRAISWKGRPKRPKPSPLDEDLILSWADAHFERNGRWPISTSGPIPECPGEHWKKIDRALYRGYRGLLPHSSLATLLEDRRGVVKGYNQLEFTIDQILMWVDAHFERFGEWPTRKSGAIAESPRDSWRKVESALRHGHRGLNPGSTLARLLQNRRGVPRYKPELNVDQILEWADRHKERHGRFPVQADGAVEDSPSETWSSIDMSLRSGLRGFTKGSSLAIVLEEHRGRRRHSNLPPYRENDILAWADAYYARTGRWPAVLSGPILEAPGENWHNIDQSLRKGFRGLLGGSSLEQFLTAKHGKLDRSCKPKFSLQQIKAWAQANALRHGKTPTAESGPIDGAPGETWAKVDRALKHGGRGLPGGSSLALLTQELRGTAKRSNGLLLTTDQILAWADTHFERFGEWPTKTSGPIAGSPGESWLKIQRALQLGHRGLEGGSSLPRLLREQRDVFHVMHQSKLTVDQILEWADLHKNRHGKYPLRSDNVVEDSPAEQWFRIDKALRDGLRGLAKGSSLAIILQEHRGVRNNGKLPHYREEEILGWADSHFARTGQWPMMTSGSVLEAPDENWDKIDQALSTGYRGLPGGSSLHKFLVAHRSKRNHLNRSNISLQQIAAWMQAHTLRHGKPPISRSGQVEDAPEENWEGINKALRYGYRGLPGGSSLSRFNHSLSEGNAIDGNMEP